MNRVKANQNFKVQVRIIFAAFVPALFVLVVSLGWIVGGQSASRRTVVATGDIAAETFVTYQASDGIKTRQAGEQEFAEQLNANASAQAERKAAGDFIQQGFFNLRTTDQLESFPLAKAAFLRAAARWAEVIQLDAGVDVNLDFGPKQFGETFARSDTVAVTVVQSFTLNQIALTLPELLANNAVNEQQAAIINSLPALFVETDLGRAGVYRVTFAQGRALGFQLGADVPANTLSINSAGANFDFDSRDGIDAGKTDFEALVARELGRILGFTSSVGNLELKPTDFIRPTIWDVFRFKSGVTQSSIANGVRVQTAGGEQVFYAGNSVLALSTAKPDGTGGDGNPASHWKDNALTGQYLGIMDPTFAPGERGVITLNDVTTLNFLGHKLNPDAPVREVLSPSDAVQEESVPLNGAMVVNRLSPSLFPAKLEAVRISLPNAAVGASLRVVAWLEPTRAGQPLVAGQATPKFLVDRTITVSALSPNGLLEVLIPDAPSFGEGDLYVGVQSASSNVRIGADVAGARKQVSFVSTDNGGSFRALQNASQSPLNLNLQAVVVSIFSATNNQAPAIEAVSPATVVPGGQSFTLHVYGKGFFPQTKDNRGFLFESVVRWNGESRATSFVSGDLLQATITAADIAQAGKARVTVFTPRENGGLESPPLEFNITPNRPAPKLTAIEPSVGIVGSGSLKLKVIGSDFTAGSMVRLNGGDRPTTLVNSTELSVDLTAADLANPGNAEITVFAPSPGGGTSRAAAFSIAPCRFTLSHPQQTFRTTTFGSVVSRFIGGTVLTPNGKCQWTARSNAAWITDVQPASGDSQLPVTFRVANNEGAPRTGTVTIGSATLTVRQNGTATTVSAASYQEQMAPDSIVTVFGSSLANATISATGATLPTMLAGATAQLTRRDGSSYPARFFFASPQQLNLLLPPNLPVPTAPFPEDYLFSVLVDGQFVAEGIVDVSAIAPAFFTANASGQGVPAAVVLRVKADGTQVYEPVAELNTAGTAFVARPIDLGAETDQVFLLLFGTGLRGRTSLEAVKLKIGGVDAPVAYVGAQGDFAGLDQVNVLLPRSLKGRGAVTISCSADTRIANSVTLTIK